MPVVPGPAGAILYRLTSILAEHWQGNPTTPMGHALDEFGKPVRRLLYVLDWIPTRARTWYSRVRGGESRAGDGVSRVGGGESR